MTKDEFAALIGDGAWDRIELWFHVEPPDTYQVTANVSGNSQAACLAGAAAVLNAVKGKTAFIRIPPEADSQRDLVHDRMLHRGYVRFSFKDEPGEWVQVPLEIERTTAHRYAPLANRAGV